MNSADRNTKVVAILQARMGSTRLPGKALVEICGKPLLAHIIERVRSAKTVDELCVGTTTAPEDRAILELAAQYGLLGYAGSIEDVLDRFYQAAKLCQAYLIVRVTGDDPFKDPEVIDRVVECLLHRSDLDYVSNTIKPTYPEGLDVEAFTFMALERAWAEARLPSEREHVTPYMWKNPDKFRLFNIEHDEDLSTWRWTVDYESDLLFARNVYSRLYDGRVFLMAEIINLLRRQPELITVNSSLARGTGYLKSVDKDECMSKLGSS